MAREEYESGTDRSMMRDAVLVSALAFAYLMVSTLAAGLVAAFDRSIMESFAPDMVMALMVFPRVIFQLSSLNLAGSLEVMQTIPLSVGGTVGVTMMVIVHGGYGVIIFRLVRGDYQ